MDLTKVKAKIKKHKLSQQDLAKSIGIHPTTLSRFVNGKTVMNAKDLLALMRALNLKAESLTDRAS